MSNNEIYSWSQVRDIVTIKICVTKDTSPKDICITLNRNSVKVNVGGEVILDDELEREIYPKDSNWYLDTEDDKKYLFIELYKVEHKDFKGMWDKLLKSDEFVAGSNFEVDVPACELSDEFRIEQEKKIRDALNLNYC